jgi:signal transduction histidine kinase
VGLPTLDDIRTSLGEIRTLIDSADHAIDEYIQIQKMASVELLARELGHDLRNGLMALAGRLFQLERIVPQDEVQDKTKEIRGILKNLEQMVDRLQSLGSDKSSEDGLIPQELTREVSEVVRFIQPTLGQNIHLELQPAVKPLPVMLCRGDLWRIMSNLLLNARDAMPEGGSLQVQVGDGCVDAAYCQNHGNAYPGHFAIVTVKDDGVGIPPELLPRIFDPLFSTKNPSMDGQKRGWGLSIVYTLVRRRGGWIDVESQPQKGAGFEVFLPVLQSPAMP